jgi:hypothetical protein
MPTLVCLQAFLTTVGQATLPPEAMEELKKYDGNLVGDQAEKELFDKIQAAAEQLRNSIIIHGWHEKGSKSKREIEFDFLIISRSEHIVLHVEVKRSYSEATEKEAFDQLDKGYEHFNKVIPFSESGDWKYIKAAYFQVTQTLEGQVSFRPEDHAKGYDHPPCQNLLLGPGTDFGKWLTEILSSQKTCAEVPCETYINILKVLFFTMYAQRDIVTNSDLLRHSEKTTEIVGSPENILFLTKEQRNVLTDPSKTRVAFLSAFGTGKTTLLFHKAKQLLEENCDVRIVIINKVQDSQLMQKYRQLLNKHTKGICTVITGTTFGLHIYTCLYLLQI